MYITKLSPTRLCASYLLICYFIKNIIFVMYITILLPTERDLLICYQIKKDYICCVIYIVIYSMESVSQYISQYNITIYVYN